MKKVSVGVIISYLMIYIVWGSTYYFIKLAVETIPPFYVVGLRFLAGGLVFIIISIAMGKLRTMPTIHEMLSALFLGTCLLVLGNGLVSLAEKSVDSYLAALTVAATPFCVAFFNKIFFNEKLAISRLFGMLCGICGVGLILYNGHSLASSLSPGIGFVVAGLCFWSLATSLGHKMNVHKNTLVNSGLQMFFGGIVAIIASVFLYPTGTQVLTSASSISWIGVAYLTIFGGIAFYCYAYLIKHEPSIRIASYAIINPLIAVTLGLVIGHEKPTRFLVLGFPLVLAGLIFILYGSAIIRSLRRTIYKGDCRAPGKN